jgi:predicted  nucleic acid-binding Zn-ribbon protein
MKNSQIKVVHPVATLPKAEAIKQLSQHMAALKAQLEDAQAQLKAAVSPGKYALNLQVNALKKQIHACKTQIDRIQKDPRSEVVWTDRLSA